MGNTWRFSLSGMLSQCTLFALFRENCIYAMSTLGSITPSGLGVDNALRERHSCQNEDFRDLAMRQSYRLIKVKVFSPKNVALRLVHVLAYVQYLVGIGVVWKLVHAHGAAHIIRRLDS